MVMTIVIIISRSGIAHSTLKYNVSMNFGYNYQSFISGNRSALHIQWINSNTNRCPLAAPRPCFIKLPQIYDKAAHSQSNATISVAYCKYRATDL